MTNEIAPGARGGIGFYVEEAVRMLQARGVESCVLIAAAESDPAAVEAHFRSVGIRAPVYGAADLAAAAPPPDLGNRFHAASHLVADALRAVCARHNVDFVEFLDYGGLGTVALRRKRLLGEFAGQVLAVRAHGTAEMIHRAEARRYGSRDNLVTYALEREGVRRADVLLASTPSLLAEYEAFYGRGGPGLVSPLPVRPLTPEPLPWRAPGRPPCDVLLVGTVQAQKGADIFVRAAVELIGRGAAEGVRFVLMGRDFPTSVQADSFGAEVRALVPPAMADRFDFRTAYFGPGELLEAARTCAFAVCPSRWEAFCLMAHELRWLGVPLVLSDIGPFRDCFVEGEDAAFFDGTPGGLADAMAEVLAGRRPLTGRRDVASLYVDAGAFSDVYARAAGLAQAAQCPAPPAEPGVTVVVARQSATDAALRTARSALASRGVRARALVVPADGAPWTDGPPPAGSPDGVRLLPPVAGGRAAALAAGEDAAEDEFVCCLREGDVVAPEYLARACAALVRCPEAAAVTCGLALCRGETGPEGVVRTETPVGLDPALVTVADPGAGHAVMRRAALAAAGVRHRPEFFALADWEFAWQMAEHGLVCEVLPGVGVWRPEPARLSWKADYHLRQRMAALHPELVRRAPSDVLQAHLGGGATDAREFLTDGWLMAHCRGLRLLRVGVRKCLAEGPRELLAHVRRKLGRLLGRGAGR